uniref:Uncharacterized protein n=1 Tax=Rhizophora mucronata TaxID=61149 RepID=A0A2P2KT49_RHIMU
MCSYIIENEEEGEGT